MIISNTNKFLSLTKQKLSLLNPGEPKELLIESLIKIEVLL